MATTIYWFSGTGNSLYVAKTLARELGDASLHPIAAGVPEEAVGGKGEKLGFVFPSYYGNLPRIVRAFVEKLKIKEESYLFTIVTMGGLGLGSVVLLNSVLKQKSLRLDYGRGVIMEGNYILKYNPVDKTKIEGKLERINKKIGKIASQINAGTRSVKSIKFSADNLYHAIETLDSLYYAEDACQSCQTCVKVCPVGNIKMENNKPVWQHHCEHCVACISWCPQMGIQYGGDTKYRRRYQNPRIMVNELMIRSGS